MFRKTPDNLRSVVFGVEDSLASTVGLLSGIASAQVSNSVILITGLVLILVEAMSMAAGNYLSSQSSAELKYHKDISFKKSIPQATIMFVSYIVSGLIPLSPYLFLNGYAGIFTSILFTLVALFFLGYFNAKVTKTSTKVSILRTMGLGGTVALFGIVVGHYLKIQ